MKTISGLKLVFTFLFALVFFKATAQERHHILTDKHRQRLERVQGSARRERLCKRLLVRDSARLARVSTEALRSTRQSDKPTSGELATVLPVSQDSTSLGDTPSNAFKNLLRDSLPQIFDSTYIQSRGRERIERVSESAQERFEMELEAELPTKSILPDSSALEPLRNKAIVPVTHTIEDKVGLELPNDVAFDSTTVSHLRNEVTSMVESTLQDQLKTVDIGEGTELNKLAGFKDQLEKTSQQMQQEVALQKIREKMSGSARAYIGQHAEKIQQAQNKMNTLKRKYEYVPNSNDLSTAVKKTSLAGEPIWRRMVIGGNFNLTQTDPLLIDLSPVLGYKFNKLFEAGLTSTYRTQFVANRNGVAAAGTAEYGFGTFANYLIYRNYFGYLEGETRRIVRSKYVESNSQSWEQALLIGLGRQFLIAGWLKMQTMVLYNVVHDNKQHTYRSPVLFKTGFRVERIKE